MCVIAVMTAASAVQAAGVSAAWGLPKGSLRPLRHHIDSISGTPYLMHRCFAAGCRCCDCVVRAAQRRADRPGGLPARPPRGPERRHHLPAGRLHQTVPGHHLLAGHQGQSGAGGRPGAPIYQLHSSHCAVTLV